MVAAVLVLAASAVFAPSEPQVRYVPAAPGEDLRVAILGEGEPVVLIPGFFGSAYGFRKVLPGLAQAGWRAVVIEPLGIGESGRPAEADYSLTAQADRVAAVMSALGLTQAVVVAHSASASIGFRLAYRHPSRVSALVTIEGGPSETVVAGGVRRALKLAPLLKLFGGARLLRGRIRAQLTERSADPSWVTDEVVDGYTRGAAADLDGTLRAFRLMAAAREPELLVPNLPQVRCPVYALLGSVDPDRGLNAAEIALLRRRLALFEVRHVPHAGHFVFEEAPDAVVAAVARARSARRADAGVGP